ncbi:TerB family tellurite resistance protein [uncultured Rikenella sp.]|uniref:TerB family tellurite resistance protein n=1 Tax=uncultured Rikenella sp. TaxID=368003 RepID=UPI0025E7123F|nr:TerB family tellurite resistance protein [uncultured Rikenella sp.]
MDSTIHSKTEQFAVVAILILIMEADGVVDPNEVKFLNRILSIFNISESELEIVSSYDFNQCREILSGMGAEELAYAKSIFTEMARCDGYTDPRELKIINRLGG